MQTTFPAINLQRFRCRWNRRSWSFLYFVSIWRSISWISGYNSKNPWRIGDDIGGAFALGAIGGGIFSYGREFWQAGLIRSSAPRRVVARNAFKALRSRYSVYGCQFAAWGGCFSFFDCSLVWLRKKEDPWNSIVSGGLTGGILTIRSGWHTALMSAAVGAVLLGLIEGVGVVMTKMTSASFDPTMAMQVDDPKNLPPKPGAGADSSFLFSPPPTVNQMTNG